MAQQEGKVYRWIRVEASIQQSLEEFCKEVRPKGVKRYGQGKGIAHLLAFYREHQGGRDAL